MRTPSTRDEDRRERGRYRRTTWLLAAAAALIIGAGVAGGTWWSQQDEPAMNVDPGEYVPPTDIVPPSSSPTSSSSSSSSSSTSTSSSSSTSSTSSSSSTSAPQPVSQPAPDGAPTRVQIESGGRSIVDASLQATTLDSEKVLAPPFGTAGWYAEPGWPKPGHTGASILVGHINHGSNPDVFWNLPKVQIGDIVTVTYGSGEVVKFKITKSEAASKKGVPQDDSIWDHDNPDPVLRLITCDPQTTLNEGHYEGNWVVWADQMVA
ncbi:MAG: class F sortase [Janibacter sp.]